jgi:uncharacterized SAM-binding protein YcdF (DUF218 family)
MIYLHKILPVLLSPIFIVLVLLTVGAIRGRRIWVISGICLLYILSMPIVSTPLFRSIELGAQRLQPEELPEADAIVALSGSMSWTETKTGFVANWADPDRFFGGVELVLAGKAPKLIFTGGKSRWQLGDQTEGDVLRLYAQMMKVPESQILVTELVENTEQEALAVKKLLLGSSHRIILVTSAFHMPRAKRLFEKVGFEVTAYPVDVHASSDSLTPMSFLPSPRALLAVDAAINEIVGRLYYQFKY